PAALEPEPAPEPVRSDTDPTRWGGGFPTPAAATPPAGLVRIGTVGAGPTPPDAAPSPAMTLRDPVVDDGPAPAVDTLGEHAGPGLDAPADDPFGPTGGADTPSHDRNPFESSAEAAPSPDFRNPFADLGSSELKTDYRNPFAPIAADSASPSPFGEAPAPAAAEPVAFTPLEASAPEPSGDVAPLIAVGEPDAAPPANDPINGPPPGPADSAEEPAPAGAPFADLHVAEDPGPDEDAAAFVPDAAFRNPFAGDAEPAAAPTVSAPTPDNRRDFSFGVPPSAKARPERSKSDEAPPPLLADAVGPGAGGSARASSEPPQLGTGYVTQDYVFNGADTETRAPKTGWSGVFVAARRAALVLAAIAGVFALQWHFLMQNGGADEGVIGASGAATSPATIMAIGDARPAEEPALPPTAAAAPETFAPSAESAAAFETRSIERVRQVQSFLASMGYDAGPANGEMSERLRAAADQFRAARDIEGEGFGPRFMVELRLAAA
ncbi:MAG: hypothetical protein MI723_15770, partial [Caulobacterales bacterium]|nr:hypothetical protein [Caulobacterales bacterium]